MNKIIGVITVGVLMGITLLVAIKAVDRITVRDCERGIKEACQYVPTK